MQTTRLRHHFFIVQTIQVIWMLLISLALINEHHQQSNCSSLLLSPLRVFHLLETPITVVGVILVSIESVACLAVFLPFRYLYLFVLIGSSLAVPLIYGPVLVVELVLQVYYHILVLRLYREKENAVPGTLGTSPKSVTSDDPPTYGEVEKNGSQFAIIQVC